MMGVVLGKAISGSGRVGGYMVQREGLVFWCCFWKHRVVNNEVCFGLAEMILGGGLWKVSCYIPLFVDMSVVIDTGGNFHVSNGYQPANLA